MTKSIVMVLVFALGLATLVHFPVQAQQEELPAGTFVLQLMLGGATAWAGNSLGKLLPFAGGGYWVGTLGAAIGAGVGGTLLGHNGNWLFAYAGSLAGWTLTNYFSTGFFNPNEFQVVPYLGARVSGRDMIMGITLIGAALFATASYNL